MRNSIFLGLVSLTLVAGTAGAGDIRTTGQFISENSAGPPMQVNSIQKVLNLNADRLDGMNSTDFAGVSELADPDSVVGVHWKNITNVPGVEIDQDCAVNTGCSTGSDPAGFPVTITQSGSYRLASNLTTSDANQTLISIQASNVTLDLQGFALLGPVTCADTPVTGCTPSSGNGDGIVVPADAARTGITILDGTVEGMGDQGIECAAPCKIIRVHVTQNATIGIQAVPGAIIENVLAFRNGVAGIIADGVVRNSHARGNGNAGFSVQGNILGSRATLNAQSGFSLSGSIVSSTAESNEGSGISLQDGATAIGNTASNNAFFGIAAFAHTTIRDNSVYSNGDDGISASESVVTGNSSLDNGVDGFSCENCLLLDNTSIGNGDQGVQFSGTDSAWGRNMLSGNASSPSGTVADMGNNICDGVAC